MHIHGHHQILAYGNPLCIPSIIAIAQKHLDLYPHFVEGIEHIKKVY